MNERDLLKRVFGKALKRKRIEMGFSQQQLEEVSDLALKTIGRIEQGKRSPELRTLYKLHIHSGININQLLVEASNELAQSERSKK